MTVTAIRQIDNQSRSKVFVTTTESDAGKNLAAGQSLGVNIWIPWCTSSDDFPRHHIKVGIQGDPSLPSLPKPFFALWQNNNQVCFSQDVRFHLDGDCVPTDCATGGDRKLIVRDNPAGGVVQPIQITLTTLG